jgi:hypothetical protein
MEWLRGLIDMVPRIDPPPCYDTEPERGNDGKWGRLVREPEDNKYGVLKVLLRADGLFVVFDPGRECPVFTGPRAEEEARAYAKEHWREE